MTSQALPATGLNRQSLGSQIAHHLREEIVLGRLAPGTPVSQQWLCERYGTSRMPVRDALVKLTGEGLIVTTKGGHSVVGRLTPEDIVDVFEIEALVHGRAARRAAGRIGDADLEELQARHDAMVAAEAAGDLERLADLNWRFHKQINVLSGSTKLVAMIRSLSLDIPQNYLLELPDWAARTIREHAGIVAALRDRDGDRAEALVSEHVRAAGGHLADYLIDKGVMAPGAAQSTPPAGGDAQAGARG
jgi:DNA-binding GntR family transcriptional regulator